MDWFLRPDAAKKVFKLLFGKQFNKTVPKLSILAFDHLKKETILLILMSCDASCNKEESETTYIPTIELKTWMKAWIEIFRSQSLNFCELAALHVDFWLIDAMAGQNRWHNFPHARIRGCSLRHDSAI